MKPFFGLAMILILSLWLKPALADVHESRDAIVTNTVKTIIETIPTSGAALPDFLETPRDVYVFITAGATYTDIKVLGQASVPPIKLADALDASLAGTALAGQRVEWSADDYAAAHVTFNQGHIGLRAACNTAPIAAVISSLQHAGFTPHLLLRTPLYAPVAALPPPVYKTTSYCWYDEKQVASVSTVDVSASVTFAQTALALLFMTFVPFVAIIVLLAANRMARDERLSISERRQRYHRVTFNFMVGSLIVPFLVMATYLRTTSWRAISDLWFSESTPAIMPFIVGPFVMLLLFLFSQWNERRLLGPTPTVTTVEMLPEEKLIHKRMAAWNFVPHLLAVVVFMVILFAVPSKSAHYRSISSTAHMLMIFLPLLGTVIVGTLYKKRLAAFVTKTIDDDLTLRTRKIGMQMQERPHNVLVESSSRANQFATITSELGGHIVVSQKLREILTPDEMDFVLAKQVAQMKNGRRLTPLYGIFCLPFVSAGLMAYGLSTHRLSSSSFMTLQPFFMIGISAVMLPMFFWNRQAMRKREAMTDQEALRVTGDPAGAELALVKMAQAAPVVSALQETTLHDTTGLMISPELAKRLETFRQSTVAQGRADRPFGYTDGVNLFRKRERP